MLTDIISYSFDMVILIIYFNFIFEKRNSKIPYPVFLFAFMLAEVYLYFSSSFINHNVAGTNRLWLNINSFLLIFAQTFFYTGKMKHRIFAAISMQVFASTSETIVILILHFLPADISEIRYGNYEYCLLMSKLIFFMMVSVTHLFFMRKKQNFSLQYTVLILLMPLISIIIDISLPQWNLTNPAEAVMALVRTVGLIITNIINYFLLNSIIQVQELKMSNEKLEQQISYQKNKYEQISSAYKNTRHLMHDAKKHFFYIQECINTENYNEITDYLGTAVNRLEMSYNRINTGNLVIDAFVSNHMMTAEKEDISFMTKITIKKDDVKIDDYDLSIILGNLLDNSLEACQKIIPPATKKIMVDLSTSKLHFVIHISNTMPDSRDKTESGLFHGYGIANVKIMTKKYNGCYNSYIEHGYYHTIVVLPCHLSF